jgi:hypothetical protein
MSAQSENSIFYRQTAIPAKVARGLDYEAGSALGIKAGPRGEARLWGLLIDACVLSVRHGSVAVAARLMHVSEAGLSGFLAGAGAEAERLMDLGREGMEGGVA